MNETIKCPKCDTPRNSAIKICLKCKHDFGDIKGTPTKTPKKVQIDNTSNMKVVIDDINMSFESMVIFMVKWVFASIPAIIIITLIIWGIFAMILIPMGFMDMFING
tara:strand:+ start:116 stop:436 length:321 start_codon:yes stop_codon:yes gene_type:complete